MTRAPSCRLLVDKALLLEADDDDSWCEVVDHACGGREECVVGKVREVDGTTEDWSVYKDEKRLANVEYVDCATLSRESLAKWIQETGPVEVRTGGGVTDEDGTIGAASSE